MRRAHDIPCWISHTNIAWPFPSSKRTSPFRGRAALSLQRFLPAHRGTPSRRYHMLFFLLDGVPRARLQPSGRCSAPSARPTSPVFNGRCPMQAKISHGTFSAGLYGDGLENCVDGAANIIGSRTLELGCIRLFTGGSVLSWETLGPGPGLRLRLRASRRGAG